MPVKTILGRWIRVYTSNFLLIRYTLDPPLPPGTNVFATISLSEVNTLFSGHSPDPTFAVNAQITYFTFYRPDGTESESELLPFGQNAVGIENCARIVFDLFAQRAAAMAQINVFLF
jgi:hypothetical protein